MADAATLTAWSPCTNEVVDVLADADESGGVCVRVARLGASAAVLRPVSRLHAPPPATSGWILFEAEGGPPPWHMVPLPWPHDSVLVDARAVLVRLSVDAAQLQPWDDAAWRAFLVAFSETDASIVRVPTAAAAAAMTSLVQFRKGKPPRRRAAAAAKGARTRRAPRAAKGDKRARQRGGSRSGSDEEESGASDGGGSDDGSEGESEGGASSDDADADDDAEDDDGDASSVASSGASSDDDDAAAVSAYDDADALLQELEERGPVVAGAEVGAAAHAAASVAKKARGKRKTVRFE